MDLLTLDLPPEVDFRENTTPAILWEADIANMRARVAAIFGQHEIDQLNCAAVPSGLLENELFGHENAAFTGALAQERDRIELAHQGSLFLDEIGDIGHYFVSTLSRKTRKSIRIIRQGLRFRGAAERLGLNRTTLQRKMERLGVLKSDYA